MVRKISLSVADSCLRRLTGSWYMQYRKWIKSADVDVADSASAAFSASSSSTVYSIGAFHVYTDWLRLSESGSKQRLSCTGDRQWISNPIAIDLKHSSHLHLLILLFAFIVPLIVAFVITTTTTTINGSYNNNTSQQHHHYHHHHQNYLNCVTHIWSIWDLGLYRKIPPTGCLLEQACRSKALYHTCFICGQRCECWSRRRNWTWSVISDVKPIIYIYIFYMNGSVCPGGILLVLEHHTLYTQPGITWFCLFVSSAEVSSFAQRLEQPPAVKTGFSLRSTYLVFDRSEENEKIHLPSFRHLSVRCMLSAEGRATFVVTDDTSCRFCWPRARRPAISTTRWRECFSNYPRNVTSGGQTTSKNTFVFLAWYGPYLLNWTSRETNVMLSAEAGSNVRPLIFFTAH